MAVCYKTRAFVFKKEDRFEADRVFSVFTEDFGRVEIVAKAIRKITSKLRGGIGMFYFSDIEFIQGKNRKTLINTALIEKYEAIMASPEKMALAGNVSLALEDFIKGQAPDQKVWNLIIDFFQKLNNTLLQPGQYQMAYNYFIWNFIAVLGFAPELSVCVFCSKPLHPNHLSFSNTEGGITCQNCSVLKKDGAAITADAVKTLRIILQQDFETLMKLKVSPVSEDDLKKISENYYRYLLSSYSYATSNI